MDNIFQEASGVLIGAFGDRVAFGYLFKKLKPVTPDEVCQMIRDGQPLFPMDVDWEKWKGLLYKNGLTRHVTLERLTAEFEKRRPDLCAAVRNETTGQAWFNKQVKELRVNLGLEQRWVKTTPPS